MNENNFTLQDKMYAFLSGDLETPHEEILFRELASNSELRMEMRDSMLISDIVGKEASKIKAPAAIKENVMKAVGGMAGGSFISGKLAHGAKYFLTAAVSVICTILIMTWLNSSNGDKNSIPSGTYDPRNLAMEKENLSPKKSSVDLSVPVTESERINIPSEMDSHKNSISKEKEDINNFKSHVAMNKTRNAAETGSVNHSFTFDNASLIKLTYANKPVTWAPDRNIGWPVPLQSGFLNRISVSLRGYYLKSYPNIDINNHISPVFENLAIGIYYHPKENFMIGIEAGQEKFGQEFTETIANTEYNYKQNPLLFWAGISARHNFTEWTFFDRVYPYARLTLGSTELGPLAKPGFGLVYTPDRAVSFTFGLESTHLMYGDVSNPDWTNKFGLSYGVSIKY